MADSEIRDPRVTIRLQAHQHRVLEAVAAHQGVSTSEVVRLAIEHYGTFYGPWAGFVVQHVDGTIWATNENAERILGYEMGELNGMKLSEVYAPESLPKVDLVLELLRETGTIAGIRLVAKRRDGSTFPVSLYSHTDISGRFTRSIWYDPAEDRSH